MAFRSFDNRSNNRGKPRGGSFGRGGGDRTSRPREMHDATCSECGRDCQVPFRPTGERPVLCSRCFEKENPREDGGSRERFSNRSDEGNRFESRAPRSSGADPSTMQLVRSIDTLNSKLDTIIRLLSQNKPSGKKDKSQKEQQKQTPKEEVPVIVAENESVNATPMTVGEVFAQPSFEAVPVVETIPEPVMTPVAQQMMPVETETTEQVQ